MLVDVTAEDVADGWRPLSADEARVAGTKIFEAQVILGIEVPGLSDLVSSGQIPVTIVRLVVARMVARYLKNPDGDRTITDSESIDDYTKSSTRIKDNSLSDGDMFVTAKELEWLGVKEVVRAPRSFEITLGGS